MPVYSLYLLYLFSLCPIFTRISALGHHLNEGGGDGPFIVSHYNPTYGIDFIPNPNYYGPKPQLRKVSFIFYQSADNIYQGYQRDLVDETPVDLTYIDIAKSSPEFHQLPQLASDFYMMNYLVKPFDNIHIRQAFALALDRDDIAYNILHRSVAKPTYHIIPQGMSGYNNLNLTGPAGITNTAGDPALAQKLLLEGLHEEGWTSVSQMPPITLTYAHHLISQL